MPPFRSNELTDDVLRYLRILILQGDYHDAAAYLIETLATPVAQKERQRLHELLALVPAETFDASAHLLALRAFLHAYTQPDAAAILLLRAIILYRAEDNFNHAGRCYVELIRLYLQQEDFQTARLYIAEAESVVNQVTDPTIQAGLYLRLAELCPDLGRLHASMRYGENALQIYRQCADLPNQFRCCTLLSIVQRQLSNYAEAAAMLEVAERLHEAAHLDQEACARILNAKAHLAWYRGDLIHARQLAERLVNVTTEAGFPKAQVYSALLLANLLRASGHFGAAAQWYQKTAALSSTAKLDRFQPWVDLNQGWLQLLTGDHAKARKLIHLALTTSDFGQRISFNVHLALLNLLDGHTNAAADLLHSAKPFYQQSGDGLAVAIIDLHLAYCQHLLGDAKAAQAQLQAALTWLAARHITYFPYWWHPNLMAQIGVWALQSEQHVALIEHMLICHVGNAARQPLLDLLTAEHPLIVQRAQALMTLLEPDDDLWRTWLTSATDEPLEQTLAELFQSGKLCRDALPQLQTRFTTAQQRNRPNPVLLAVFGLYLGGATVKEIAAQLQRAPSSIRNYITQIYQIFELDADAFPSLHARRTRLVQLAAERGFVEINAGHFTGP